MLVYTAETLAHAAEWELSGTGIVVKLVTKRNQVDPFTLQFGLEQREASMQPSVKKWSGEPPPRDQ